jgi:DNA-binding response OmpR family regulator
MRKQRIRKTILVVDDQPHVRRLLRQIFDRDGYAVLEAEDEHSAVETVRNHDRDIDLAVVDVELPGHDGPHVAARLDRDFGVSQKVFITGLDPDELIARGRIDACDPLVRKPFTVAGLTGTVKAMLHPRPQPSV